MSYLLDTNVVSALRVRGRNPGVEAWASSVPLGEQHISVLSIAEIERGIASRERADPAQAAMLRRWFERQVLPTFSGRILPFDLRAARILGGYRVPENAPLDDAPIAATAEAAGFTLVTRNLEHVLPLGVACLNPWDPAG